MRSNRRRFGCRYSILLLLIALLLSFSSDRAMAQTTAFTYQGRLTDGGTPANGNYDLQFALWDSSSGGSQIGATQNFSNISVSSGIFTVTLDFGANAFPGANRFLEIGARLSGASAFTLLTPRQQITSTPYAVRSGNATAADTATNATQLGGIGASQYVQTSDARLTDSRAPTAGSSNYIQNSALQQSTSNFNITGNGTAGGTLSGNVVNATTQYNLGGSRVLSTAGANNLFAGVSAGASNTTGDSNAFFGALAGNLNSTGNDNAFFGQAAGQRNTTGKRNSFFGQTAGFNNSTGKDNTFVGNGAGFSNTADGNSFVGSLAGLNNTSGSGNAFFGFDAGVANTGGGANTFVGFKAGFANTGDQNTFVGFTAGSSNTTAIFNSFFGKSAGESNTTGENNTFVGEAAGLENTTGCCHSYFGSSAGLHTTTGQNNSFFGFASGLANTTGSSNTTIGYLANVGANNLDHATALGADAVVSTSNTVALGRSDGSDTVRVPGKLVVSSLGVAGSTSLCRNFLINEIAPCSSSLRYKTNLAPYRSGMDVINRLRPITFDWKQGGMHDVGFGAEDVEKIDPLLVTYNDKGQVEGVKYDRISAVLVNALKEQQARIESQQHEIEALKKLVCGDHPAAELCKSN